VGLAGLITAANAPVANLAWKIFPALICGNAALVKASEHAPLSAWAFGKVAANSALPAGLLSFWQGKGNGIGSALVEHPRIPLVSFTGSTKVGQGIAAAAGSRLAKVGLELGGKNPLVVCDDSDLDKAVHWAALSAFSNAGQRCASASRILVFESVYNAFREKFLAKVKSLRVGPSDEDDLGPVIHEQSLANILEAVSRAQAKGAKILAGGQRLVGENHKSGSYMAPTVLENVSPDDDYSKTELFGPVTALYPVKDFAEAVALANRSPYGLTASIHTRSWNRAQEFQRRVEAGVVVVNGGTHGSEPHMPFGGVKDSGNGIREPGPEALDFYSNTKTVYHMVDPLDL
jgi:aldehyde dehydrogenase (NAD+)